MDLLDKLKGIAKETWACINEGGTAITQQWREDTGFRKAVSTHPEARRHIEGGLFIDDLKEFYAAMDKFNATRPEHRRFNLMLHADIAEGLLTEAAGEQKTMMGVGPLALERNGRIYQGRYFSDMGEISGFSFTQSGTETRFFCGMGKKTDFEGFVTRLLNPPPQYPHPTLVRSV